MKRFALIVAGGSGTRMQNALPKQFIEIGGMPILMHTILKFKGIVQEIILVLPENEILHWEELSQKHCFKENLTIVKGGNSRIESVKNGLSSIHESNTLVAIHDGVRPFIHREIIEYSFEIAEKKGNAIVAVSLKDSIREVSGENNKSLDRNLFRLVQTPQTFHTDFIKFAYQADNITHLTDDASVAENKGMNINLIEGNYSNIKITTPEDLIIATAFLKFEDNL